MQPIRLCRKIEVWNVQTESWIPIHMGQLEKGDIFRMWNPDKTRVVNKDVGTFISTGPAVINCDPYDKELPRQESILK